MWMFFFCSSLGDILRSGWFISFPHAHQPTRHPSYFCWGWNFDWLENKTHKIGASKMKATEWNMINRRKQKKKENSRNIWGRKKYSKSSFCECMNRCHILFLFWDSNMYFQSKLLCVFVCFFYSHFILLATQTTVHAFNASREQTIKKSFWCIKLQAS